MEIYKYQYTCITVHVYCACLGSCFKTVCDQPLATQPLEPHSSILHKKTASNIQKDNYLFAFFELSFLEKECGLALLTPGCHATIRKHDTK